MCIITYDAVPPRRSFPKATDSIRTRLTFPSRVRREGICQLLTCMYSLGQTIPFLKSPDENL